MKPAITILSILIYGASIAQTTKTIKPKPDKATVYLYGAELSYQDNINLTQGANEIILEGISPNADETSISAYFKGAMVIDTRKSLRYPESPKTLENSVRYNVFINRIKDSMDEIDFLIRDCNNKKSTLDKERYLLLNNRLMRGEFARDSIALLKSSLDLLRSRMNNIDEEQLILDRKLYKHNKLRSALSERLSYYELLSTNSDISFEMGKQFKPIYQIIVTIEAEAAVSGSLTVKYFVANAGWLPRYDILASSGKEKIQLVYRAQVYQNTDVDWKDVSLTLSTSNPMQGNVKPVLTPWNLFYGYPNSYFQSQSYGKVPQVQTWNYNNVKPSMAEKKISTKEESADMSLGIDDVKAQEPIFTMSDNLLRAEYVIKTKYSIASDNKAHNVIINNLEVPVQLTYMAVPKLDKDAFLMGKVVNWEDLNLLPANAKLYFDESYIGLTVVDPNSVKDTLYIDLGRDKSIIVKRQNIKDKCKEQLVGDDKVITKSIEITVRNTKSIALDFEIEDQIPISNDNSIKIELLEKDKAHFNEITGKLTWRLHIKPKESKKIVFSFEVRHPKGKVIGTLN